MQEHQIDLTTCDWLRIDAREAVSSLNQTAGNRSYFFLDLRRASEGQGILPTGIVAEGSTWKTPLLVEGVLNCLRELKPTVGLEERVEYRVS